MANLYRRRPAIDQVSLAFCRRQDGLMHPQDIPRLMRSADVILRHTQARFGFSNEEWGYWYEELKQVALLHLIRCCQDGRSGQYAYTVAQNEVKDYVLFQIFQKDPRFNRRRDQHLALDVQLDCLDDFDMGEGGRLMPDALIEDSAESPLLYREYRCERDACWKSAEKHVTEILTAMTKRHSRKAREGVQMTAKCLILRLRFGYTAEEIAQETGICRNTVKTNLRKARERVVKFHALSCDEQAARLLRAYFSIEALEDIPQCQLQAAVRSLHVRIQDEDFILSPRKKGKKIEVYLVATRMVVGKDGKRRSPQVYVGVPPSVSVEAIHRVHKTLQQRFFSMPKASQAVMGI